MEIVRSLPPTGPAGPIVGRPRSGFFTPEPSRSKAVAAAAFLLPTNGGVPIVRGGGTGEQDHECAVAGAQALAG